MSEKRSNNFDAVAKVYGAALLELAQEGEAQPEIDDEVGQLLDLWEQDADLERLLSSRVLSADNRASSIDAVFKDRVSDLMYRFLRLVNDKDRLGELPNILRAYQFLALERRGIVEADVHTAIEMDEDNLRKVAERIGEVIGKQVVVNQHVDPELIGGLKIRIGDQLIDGSTAAQLRLIRNRLLAAGHARARQGASFEV